MAATNVQAFSGDVEVVGKLTASGSEAPIRWSSVNDTAFPQNDGIKYWKIATLGGTSAGSNFGQLQIKGTIGSDIVSRTTSINAFITTRGGLSVHGNLEGYGVGGNGPKNYTDIVVYDEGSTFTVYLKTNNYYKFDILLLGGTIDGFKLIQVFPCPTTSGTDITPTGTLVTSSVIDECSVVFADNGNVGIGTTNPDKELTVAGNMELGTRSADYQHFRIGGGNSSGFLYGAFAKYGDGIHMGYNFYNDNSSNQIPNVAGATSRITMQFGQIQLHTGGVNTEPNNNALCINSAGNVGIGRTNPIGDLHVTGGTAVGGVTDLYIGDDADADETSIIKYYKGDNGSNPGRLVFGHYGDNFNDGTSTMCIEKGGFVGIGKSNPSKNLDVIGTVRAGSDLDAPLYYNNGGITKIGSAYNYSTQVRAGGSIQVRIDDTEIARFQSGALGIGTNSPSTNSRLSIYRAFANPGNGNQPATDSGSSILWKSNLNTFGSTPAPAYALYLQDAASIFFQPRSYQYVGSPHSGFHGCLHMSAGYSPQSFPTTPSNFALSSANGLGLGTADPNPFSLDAYNRGYRARNASGHWAFGIGNTEFYVYNQGTSPSNRGVYMPFNGTSWVPHSSDSRTKKNFTPIENSLEKLRNIRPVLFHYLEEEDTDEKRLGFIAQDWLAQQPECVYHNESAGNLTMSLTETIPVLCAGIKELDSNQQVIQEVVNNLSDFTGQHRCLMKDISPNDYPKYEGLVVSANNNEYLNHDSITKPTINEALPIVSLTNKEKDKTCLGVISLKADPESYLPDDPTRLKINALGEGGIWTININGSLESGDYITSSNIAGYGMRQDDDIIHNYTIAKITQDCDFTKKMRKIKTLVKELKDITYYKFTYKMDITKDEYDVTDESLRLAEDYEYYSREEIRFVTDDTPGLYDSDGYQRIDDIQTVSKEEYDQNHSLYDKETKYKIKDSDEIVNIDEEIYNLDPSKYDVEVIYSTKSMHLSKEEYDKNPSLYNVIKIKIKEHKCDKDKFEEMKDEDGTKHEFKLATSTKYYKLDKQETTEPHPGYETEVRQELVNVLDENKLLTKCLPLCKMPKLKKNSHYIIKCLVVSPNSSLSVLRMRTWSARPKSAFFALPTSAIQTSPKPWNVR
jgi:hypothetical protein